MIFLHALAQLDEPKRRAAADALRLLAFSEKIVCPMRCYLILRERPASRAVTVTSWWLVLSAAGAAGEIIKVLSNKGNSSLKTAAERAAASDPQLARLLARIKGPEDRAMRAMSVARDKFWAHSDGDVAEAFVNSLKGTEEDPPIVETSGEKTVGDTVSAWPMKAWFQSLDKAGVLSSTEDTLKFVEELIGLVQDVAVLARTAANEHLRAEGFVLKGKQIDN